MVGLSMEQGHEMNMHANDSAFSFVRVEQASCRLATQPNPPGRNAALTGMQLAKQRIGVDAADAVVSIAADAAGSFEIMRQVPASAP